MGLIRAITSAAGGVMADQWREYFYCDSLGTDTLVVKGKSASIKEEVQTIRETRILFPTVR